MQVHMRHVLVGRLAIVQHQVMGIKGKTGFLVSANHFLRKPVEMCGHVGTLLLK